MGQININNAVALVTGGSRGIGRCIAIILAEAGYRVAFTYNAKKKDAIEVEKIINDTVGKAKAFQMAIEDRESVISTIGEIKTYFNDYISVLVNNAAIAQEKPFNTITDDDWANMLKVNLQGPFICSQEILPGMIDNKWGRIINITSIGGHFILY